MHLRHLHEEVKDGIGAMLLMCAVLELKGERSRMLMRVYSTV